MERKYINELKEGDKFVGYFLVKKKELKVAKNENLYLDLELVDKTGSINAKVWDNSERINDYINRGDIIGVVGFVERFRDNVQVKLERVKKIEPDRLAEKNITYEDFIMTTSRNIDEMWDEIMDSIESISNQALKELLKRIYIKYEKSLKSFPGSMKLHHAYRGGLLEHIYITLKIVDAVSEIYKGEIDRDLLIAGILVHDIGKIRELSGEIFPEYTDEGNFLGHVVLGRDILLEEIKKIKNFPELLKLKLEHIILSHHGKFEWQSPKEPAFIEAQIVHQIDEMDTRLYQMKNSIICDSSSGNWTSKNNYFHRALFKGEYKRTTEDVAVMDSNVIIDKGNEEGDEGRTLDKKRDKTEKTQGGLFGE
ncbi:MAG: HD domain-containing protein [Candidatus Marinimicrobia bacterium]|nr:HD domain-containing protein [Candidatus Neomarinimicrobiota bacterium]